mgnify:CR=1 FL=1
MDLIDLASAPDGNRDYVAHLNRLCDAAGVEYDADALYGQSILPVLTGEGSETRSAEESFGIEVSGNAALYRGNSSLPPAREALLHKLVQRILGVQRATETKYVMLHAPRERLARISEILPGAETPTVLPLESQPDRVAVHALCTEQVFWEHLEELKAAGASAILVLPVEKMLA